MSSVFVLDANKQPLNPVHPGWARKSLSSGRAAVYKRYPIILKTAISDVEVQPPACAPGRQAKAVVPTGKKAGIYIGRVAIRSTGSFNIKTPRSKGKAYTSGTVQGISYRYCKLVQQLDGYTYAGGQQFLPD